MSSMTILDFMLSLFLAPLAILPQFLPDCFETPALFPTLASNSSSSLPGLTILYHTLNSSAPIFGV